MDNIEEKSFIEQLNKNGKFKKAVSDEELDKVSGGKCWFSHDYEIVYPTYFNGEFNGARFECKDCGDSVWAKKRVGEKYEEISYSEFQKLFGHMM